MLYRRVLPCVQFCWWCSWPSISVSSDDFCTLMKSDRISWSDPHPFSLRSPENFSVSRFSELCGTWLRWSHGRETLVNHELIWYFSGMSARFLPPSSRGQWARKALCVFCVYESVGHYIQSPSEEPFRVIGVFLLDFILRILYRTRAPNQMTSFPKEQLVSQSTPLDFPDSSHALRRVGRKCGGLVTSIIS